MSTMTATRTILVIDDDADFSASVRSLLEAEGYTVLSADSGRHGLELLHRQRPDAVVLDIMMENPEEGYGINEAIKFSPEFEGLHDVPVIMVSSIQQTPAERFGRAEELCAICPDRYLTKPLDLDAFLQAVHEVVHAA